MIKQEEKKEEKRMKKQNSKSALYDIVLLSLHPN